MKKFTPLFFLITLLINWSCERNEEISTPIPEPGYPFTYYKMSQEELAVKNELFNSVNHIEGLTLNEFGFLSGNFTIKPTSEINVDFIKNMISEVIQIYNKYLEAENLNQIDINGNIFVVVLGGSLLLDDYLKYFKFGIPLLLYFQQAKLGDYSIENGNINFFMFSDDNQVSVGGCCFPQAIIPSNEIIPANKALLISLKYIQKNYADKLPIDLEGIDENNFKKILYPQRCGDKIEIHECWKIFFKKNAITTYIDTQTGDVIQSFYRTI